MSCDHLRQADDSTPQTTEDCQGCQDCLIINFTGWVNLRRCLECGYIGCCDSSPYRHATEHYRETKHPVIRSFEPGETWSWCYVDELLRI